MRNKLKLLFLTTVLLIFCFSCKDEPENKQFIEKLATIQNDPLSPYFNYYLYFKTDNGKIVQINVDGLYEIYKSSHPIDDKNFDIYLKNLFNQKEVIKIKDIEKYDKGNNFFAVTNVAKNIDKMPVEEIEKKYLEKDDDDFRLVPKNLTLSETVTILFRMFNDGFLINPIDLVGYYSITKYKEKDFK